MSKDDLTVQAALEGSDAAVDKDKQTKAQMIEAILDGREHTIADAGDGVSGD